MSMKKLLPIVLGATLSLSAFASDTIEGSLSSDAVKVDASLDQGKFFFDVGGMYHSDDGKYGYIGAHIEDIDTAKDYPVQIGLGLRLMAINTEYAVNNSGMSVALGGYYRYTFPKANRFSVLGSLYYSPQVLSFQNIDSMYQMEVRGEYRTLRNALVFLRYGFTSVDLDGANGDVDMNKGIGIGISTTF